MFDGTGSTDDLGIVNFSWTLAAPQVPSQLVMTLPGEVTDAVFDPVRPYVYLSSRSSRTVSFVDIATRTVVRTFNYSLMPESLALTPDASRLYVALLTRDHDPYWFDGDGHEGYVAGFNLANRTQDRYFRITEDPFGFLATGDGHLVISSGSGQWTYAKVFSATDGTETGRTGASVRETTRIALHPSEGWIYGATNGVSPSDIERYSLSGGSIAYAWKSPYWGDHRMGGDLWVSPRGDMLVTRGGDLFRSTPTQSGDMEYIASMTPSYEVAWDVDFAVGPALVAVAQGEWFSISDVRYYDMNTYQPLGGAQAFGLGLSFVAIRNDRTYGIVNPGGQSATLYVAPLPRIVLYGPQPTYAFTEPGTYVLTLTTRDAPGQTDTDTVTVTVRDVTAPIVDAGSDRTVFRETPVGLDGSSSFDNVGIASYTWTFTDGLPRTLRGARTAYIFATPGTYVVTLTVADDVGNEATDTVTITVKDIPLTLYDLSPRGFRVGIPEGWDVDTSGGMNGTARIELDARGNGTASYPELTIESKPSLSRNSDDALLALAEHVLADLSKKLVFALIMTPEIVEARNTRVALFEIHVPGLDLIEVWGVAASPEWYRMWTIIGVAPAYLIDEYRPFFRASIRSFEIAQVPGILQNPVLLSSLVATGSTTAAATVAVLFGLRRIGRSKSRVPTQARPGHHSGGSSP